MRARQLDEAVFASTYRSHQRTARNAAQTASSPERQGQHAVDARESRSSARRTPPARSEITNMSVTKSGVGPAEFAKDLILGGSSGCLAKTICAPLERVKIVLQTAKSNDGMLRTAQSIIRDQGTTALWRGI